MLEARLNASSEGDRSYRTDYEWVSLEHISPHAAIAVIASEDQQFPFHDGFDLNSIRESVRASEKGRKLRLTEKEASILKYLYRAGAKAVSREELLAEVWGYNAAVTTHTLETHVYRLRQKIEPDPAAARLLLTEAGGYRLAP